MQLVLWRIPRLPSLCRERISSQMFQLKVWDSFIMAIWSFSIENRYFLSPVALAINGSTTAQVLYASFLFSGVFSYVGYETNRFAYFGLDPARSNSRSWIEAPEHWSSLSQGVPKTTQSFCSAVNSPYVIDQPPTNSYYAAILNGVGDCRTTWYTNSWNSQYTYSYLNKHYNATGRGWYKLQKSTCK